LTPQVRDLVAQSRILLPQNRNLAPQRVNQLANLSRENHPYLDSHFPAVCPDQSPRAPNFADTVASKTHTALGVTNPNFFARNPLIFPNPAKNKFGKVCNSQAAPS
jgi:hypothetical protein